MEEERKVEEILTEFEKLINTVDGEIKEAKESIRDSVKKSLKRLESLQEKMQAYSKMSMELYNAGKITDGACIGSMSSEPERKVRNVLSLLREVEKDIDKYL